MCRSGELGWKTMLSGSRWLRRIAHGVEGDEGVFVVGAVVGGVLDLGLEDADDLEDVAFDLNGFAYGRVAVEELLRGVRAEDDDLTMLGEVGGLEVAALVDVEFAHAAVGEVDCLALDVDDLGAVLEAEAVVGLGADGCEEGHSIAHGFDVAVEKFDLLAGALAACLHAGLSAPHHDDVVAEAEEAVEHAFAEALAVAEEQDDRYEAPDDAEHGEAGAQTVAEEGVDALADDLGEVHG